MTGAASLSERDEFARLLAWAYRGEVAGEAMFDAPADAWADEGPEDGMRLLAELERRMAGALVPLLQRHSVDGGNDDRSRQKGRDNAAAIAAQGWNEFIMQFEPVTTEAIARYQRLQALAPAPDAVFDVLIAHEEALREYAAPGSANEGGASLDAVRSVIEQLADTAPPTS